MKIIKSYNQFIFEKLQRIVTKSSSSGRTKEVQSIHDNPRDAKSRSSYVLLAKKLRDQEFLDLVNSMSDSEFSKGEMSSNIHMKLKISLNNLRFLKDTKSKLGELYCEYCPKGPLVIYDIDVKNIKPENLRMRDFRFSKFDKKDGATADHKIPQTLLNRIIDLIFHS